jgi:archaellin
MTVTKRPVLLSLAVALMAAGAAIAILAASACTCQHGRPAGPHATRSVSVSKGVTATSAAVPCPLTHAAGVDGAHSCWSTHTGVQAGTGYTVDRIELNPTAAGFTEIDGNVTITKRGTVIDHEWINGCVAINAGANNVTIKNTLITSNGATCQSTGSGHATAGSAVNAGQDGSSSAPTGTLFQDITVDGGTGEADYGVTLPHGECLRCNVLHFDQGILSNTGTAGNPVVFEGDYVHDTMLRQRWESSTKCGHRNGFYLNSSTYVTVRASYAIMTGYPCVTGAISLQADYGHPDHITIQNNYAEGAGGRDFTGGCATGTTVTNNAFSSRNGYGGSDFADYFNGGSSGNAWSGNAVAETGAAVDAPGGC